MSEDTNTSQNTNIGALWARESRNGGQKYLAGNVKLDIDGEEIGVDPLESPEGWDDQSSHCRENHERDGNRESS